MNLKFIVPLVCSGLLFGTTCLAQKNELKLKECGTATLHENSKSRVNQFSAGKVHYYFTEIIEETFPIYYLETYNSETGKAIFDGRVKFEQGVFNDAYYMKNQLNFNDEAGIILEHEVKKEETAYLEIRKLGEKGEVNPSGTVLLSKPLGKMLNSGEFIARSSANGKFLAAFAELPFQKNATQDIKLALFNDKLEKVGSLDYSLPGENVKRTNFIVQVDNNGIVYLLRIQPIKSKDVLTLFTVDLKAGGQPKEQAIVIPEDKILESYRTTLSPDNKWVMGGIYKNKDQRGGLSTGVVAAVFNENNELKINFNPFSTPLKNLYLNEVEASKNTLFISTEEFKKENITPAGSTVPTGVKITHLDGHVLGVALNDVSLKFQKDIKRNLVLTAGENLSKFDFGSRLVNDQFYIFYSDLQKNYDPKAEYPYLLLAATINESGELNQLTTFKNDHFLENYFIPYGNSGLSNGKGCSFLARNTNYSQLIQLMPAE